MSITGSTAAGPGTTFILPWIPKKGPHLLTWDAGKMWNSLWTSWTFWQSALIIHFRLHSLVNQGPHLTTWSHIYTEDMSSGGLEKSFVKVSSSNFFTVNCHWRWKTLLEASVALHKNYYFFSNGCATTVKHITWFTYRYFEYHIISFWQKVEYSTTVLFSNYVSWWWIHNDTS